MDQTGQFTLSGKFVESLCALDGAGYARVRERLQGRQFDRAETGLTIELLHVQGSTGADPASVARLTLPPQKLGIDPSGYLSDSVRRLATFDYLLRIYVQAVRRHCRSNRGDEGSGTFQVPELPQQVLERNLWQLGSDGRLQLLLRVSLPGRRPASLIGPAAADMFAQELPQVLAEMAGRIAARSELGQHVAAVQDAHAIAARLAKRRLVAFVPDRARLPRQSGVSELPADPASVVPFQSPPSLRVRFELPRGGSITGMGIPAGVTVIVGGAFHGKSTLLAALAKGVWPHVPDDGRERLVTDRTAVMLRAEDGRSVRSLNISPFVRNLPDGRDTSRFSTENASGSTSEAAALVESLWAGCRLLLIDEDTSATNFLVRDELMCRFVPGDPIAPLLFHARALFDRYGVSTVLVSGSNSQFLKMADCVIEMRRWRPVDRSADARAVRKDEPLRPADKPLAVPATDTRKLAHDNFNPDYHDRKRGKLVPERIKPLRAQPLVLEYGDELVDLSALDALVDPDQVLCIGRALCWSRQAGIHAGRSPTELAGLIDAQIATAGLAPFQTDRYLYLARPRRVDLAGALNRLRSLRIA